MKQVISTEKHPIKMWLDDIEDGAIQQAKNLANLPFTFKHVAIMPDAHQGYGMPIGGVLATKGAIIPNAVGVDIGCGMCAMRTNWKVEEIEHHQFSKMRNIIQQEIPVGFEHYKNQCIEAEMPALIKKSPVYEREYESARYQLGTLGGGNHFIELQKGSDGLLWIMIHSGSRNLGKKVADHYNKIAVALNDKYYSSVESEQGLAFLPVDTDEYDLYLQEMNNCVDFAKRSRRKMMAVAVSMINREMPKQMEFTIIDVAHNYARWENHFNENVIVHRKGATSAREGEVGIIPGSQGTKSYIVKGLGNPQSFNSCSHGAGRAMGRKQAQKNLNLADEIARLDSQGILHNIKTVEDLDEAAGAYKNIDVVMKNQDDLVEIVTELTPLAVIKG